MTTLQLDHIEPLQRELNAHPIYGAIRTLDQLRLFMAHHVYSVWDFMSLLKYLQQCVAPASFPWTPRGDPDARFLINHLVLEEESDTIDTPDGPRHLSHFELYLAAMDDISANAAVARDFVAAVSRDGLSVALADPALPQAARDFMSTTFCFINEDKPHEVAAAFALGRERIIPEMFRRILAASGVEESAAPAFCAYLNRHIHLDEDFHGPLSMRLLEHLCDGDPEKLAEAEAAAEEAICARIRFWDAILDRIEPGVR